MNQPAELLVAIWREACRHIRIDEAAERIFALLVERLPAAALVVRRLDVANAALETVAVASVRHVEPPGRTALTAAQMRELMASRGRWQASGPARHEQSALTRLVLPRAGRAGESLVGPLLGSDGVVGFLVIVLRRGQPFTRAHHDLFDRLLEPFAAALENDRRLHELATLREVAEADRRTLLARLGRREIGTSIIGADAGLRAVMERVETVCRSDVPVLLLGDTGTGKEVVARAIHERSPRREGPFIRVNCGAIPGELIDSQLFGHERGSFTGATNTHRGWFERADGGTLFLDEIGELPPAAQVRLLRVLQDGYVERVGSQCLMHVDVRVVAATHRDLASMVRERQFREDLWYRIAVFPISIPPLRERIEDIPALACHFSERAATRFGLPLVMPTPDDMRLLTAYAWPGNVRELAAVIDRAALLGNGRCLEVATALGATPAPAGGAGVPLRTPAAPAPPARSQPGAVPTGQNTGEVVSLDSAMRAHIESALRASLGRIEGPFGAAARLRINPNTLRSRMRKLNIKRADFRATRTESDV